MQGPDYIFALQSKAFAFWQLDATGGVTINNNPYFLEFSPDGWNDISISNIRNLKYWGIDRTVSIPLTYVQDAAQILKTIFYTLGIEESVYLVIAAQKLDYTPGVNYGYWYKQIYRGEIDLSTFIHVGSKVTCTTLEDGIAKYLKANENTVIEVPMNVPEALFLKMDGIRLHEKLNYQDVSGFDISILSNGSESLGPVTYLGHDGNSVGFAMDSESSQNVTGIPFSDKVKKQNTILVNVDQPTTSVTITGVLEFKCTAMVSSPAFAMKFRFLTSNQLIANQNDYQIVSTAAMVVGQTYTQPFTIVVPLQRGESLLRENIFFGGPGTDATIQFTENSKFSITFISRQATTYIPAFRAQYLFQQLVNKFTEGNFSVALSAYFEKYKNIVFTCGNGLRGLTDPTTGFSSAVMQISWSSFFQFWDSFDNDGISEQLTVLDFGKKQDLIDRSNVIPLSGPADGTFKTSIDKTYLFNELAIGYPDLSSEVGVLNGVEEWNCGMLFSIGTTKSPAKIDKISKIKAACYEIELVRVTTVQKDTTDNKADNDLFVLAIDGTLHPAADSIPAYYELDRSLNASATGLIEPQTVFNLPLSPKRMIINNETFFRSSLYLADNKILAYQSADRNNKVASGGVVEKADVPVSEMGQKFFLPLVMEGDFEAPDDLEALLDIDPLQTFSFPVDGTTYEGILLNVSVAPSSRKAQSYKFYSVPENDIKKLIQYYG